MNKTISKTLKVVFIFITILIIAAVSIPYLFKDKIIAKVKTGINENIEAIVDFKDIDISFLKSFPSVSVSLNELNISGKGAFNGNKLIQAKKFDINLDFWSVWNGGNPYKINQIHLDNAYINLVKLSDGTANYLISKPAKSNEQPQNFQMTLQKYSIENSTLIYDDRGMDLYAKLENMNHTGKGDFNNDIYDLDTKTVADKLNLRYGNITYLKDAKAHYDAIINADMKQMKFTLKDNEALINKFRLKGEGWTQLNGDDISMDFKFNAPTSDFKDLLSIIPNAMTADFDKVNTSGTYTFNGFVKGNYNGLKNQLPAFAINTKINKGNIKYPGLPMGISDINAGIEVNSPSSDFDQMTVKIPDFGLKIGNNPIAGYFNLSTPISDPNIDTKIKGILNISELNKAFPMENMQQLTGIVNADILLKSKLSAIENKFMDQINISGNAIINGMNIKSKNQPQLKIDNMKMSFSPSFVQIDEFTGIIGNSDITASGRIDNILAYFSPNKTMKGDIKFVSNTFDANEWMNQETKAASGKNPTDVQKPFDRFDFTIDGKINKLIYDKYDITNSVAKGNITSSKFKINNFYTKVGNSDFAGNGEITNLFNYLFDHQILNGDINFRSGMLDMNQFMTPKPVGNAPNVATEPFPVPDNVAIVIHSKIDKLLYTNMDMTNVKGDVVIRDKEAKIQNCTANAMGGTIELTGGYNTQNIEKPKFDMAFNFINLDFQKSFQTLNTFQKLAPLGALINGKFNTKMSFSGELGKDLMPNLNTLNAAGLIQTISGAISGIKPLQEIGNKLNIEEIKNFDLRDTKNYFEIANGIVTVKEFDKKVKDIALKISGTHSLTNEMNYLIKGKIPRKLLEKNPVGTAAGKGFDFLSKEAAKYGVKIDNGAFVNVQFNITGSFASPKLGIKVLGADGESTIQDEAKSTANAVINKAKDSIATRANEEFEKAKSRAKQEADRIADSIQNVANRKIDEAKNKAIEEAKKQVGDKLGTAVGGKVDTLLNNSGINDKAKDEINKAKDKLDKWNPFKKKKD